MSLIDALLLEPYLGDARLDGTAPREVWLAVRTESVGGDGTLSNPFDASVKPGVAIPIVSLVQDDLMVALASTGNTPHGYANGDCVTIAGATGSGAEFYNGVFPIFDVTATTFRYRMADDPLTGEGLVLFDHQSLLDDFITTLLLSEPAAGTITCRKDTYRFDDLMKAMPARTTLHLGPGVFETQGFPPPVGGTSWQPKTGQKIIGSGLEVTTLQLANACLAGRLYHAVFGNYDPSLRHVEVSDLTIDCNLSGQPIPGGRAFAPLACGGIVVGGRHIRLRRIRVINFGTQHLGVECFVLDSALYHPRVPEALDCVIEECIVEQPSRNNARETSCIGFVGADPAFHRACLIRNCFVDCEHVQGAVPVASITYENTGTPQDPVWTATLRTRIPHNRQPNQWIVVTGAMENGVASRHFSGSFQVTERVDEYVLKYRAYASASDGPPTASPTGDIWIDRIPSQFVAVEKIELVGDETTSRTAKVTTETPHNRVPGQNVAVFNALIGPDPINPFNGSFLVDAVPSPFELIYTMAAAPGTVPSGQIFVGVSFHTLGAYGGTAAVTEGNRVFNGRFGSYTDTGSTKDVTIRDNHFFNFVAGPFQALGAFAPAFPGASISHDSPTSTATYTTNPAPGIVFPHGLSVGQQVIIAGASPVEYNGTFRLKAIPTPTSFQYELVHSGLPNATDAGTYRARYEIRHTVIENNDVELIRNIHPTGWGSPQAVSFLGATQPPQFTFREALVRENLIRGIGDVPDPFHIGIFLDGCEEAIVQDNITGVASAPATPIQERYSGTLDYFDNRDFYGSIVKGSLYPSGPAVSEEFTELALAIEENLLLSI